MPSGCCASDEDAAYGLSGRSQVVSLSIVSFFVLCRQTTTVNKRQSATVSRVVMSTGQVTRMDGWFGFDGILSTQMAAISCMKELSLLVRPTTGIKGIIHLG